MFFECRQTNEAQNLAALQATIALQLNEPPLAFASLKGALEQLFRRASDEPLVLVKEVSS